MDQLNSSTSPTFSVHANEWFELGSQCKEHRKVVVKQPSSSHSLLSTMDIRLTAQEASERARINRPAQITYTNVAPLRRGDDSSTNSLFTVKQKDSFQNYYRQKLQSSKVLFQNSKLTQLDMLDSLIWTQLRFTAKFETDEAVRLFTVITHKGDPLFKVVEGSSLEINLCSYAHFNTDEFDVSLQSPTICAAAFAEVAVRFGCTTTTKSY
jgi:hypothetical protein